MSYPSETLVHMARIWLPDRFVIHDVQQFAGAMDRITAWFWYRETFGDVTMERPIGMAAGGSLNAIQWMAGVIPNAPGFSTPWIRTRANLFRLAEIFELMVNDKITMLENHPDVDPYLDPHYARGVLVVLEWALGLRDEYPGVALHPEEVQAARTLFAQRQQQSAA
jgi:hypothetical protein